MGTVVTFDVTPGGDPVGMRELAVCLARARAGLQRADATFSTWRAHSPLSRLRRGEIAVDDAPGEIGAVLAACASAREASGGWFDPWAVPGGVDPTGYVKGWAAQRALDVLLTTDVTSAVVNAAGDVAVARPGAPGTRFRIGVVDPFDRHRLACVVLVAAAIATSGTAERGPHLIDPRTGTRTARAASASVTGPDLGLADALATGLAVGGREALEHIEALADYEALMIDRRGRRSATSGFPFA